MKRIFIFLAIVAVIVVVSLFLPKNGEVPVVEFDPSATYEPQVSSEGNMRVYWPQPNAMVARPFAIFGEARVFENILSYRLLDADGALLVNGFTTANAADIGQFGPFAIPLWYDQRPAGAEGFVEVFTHSAMDGAEIELVRIPVKLSSEEMTAVNVHFGNAKADPGVMNCDRTFPTVRIVPKTEGVARAALTEVHQGTALH